MDAYEATRIVFTRIQSLDPENASKIMGLLLIQDHGEKEMIRLAFGPEALVHSIVVKARKDLGLGPVVPPLGLSTMNNNNTNSPSTPSTPSSPSPFIPNPLSRQNSRLLSNLSPSSWAPSNLSDFQSLDDLISPTTSAASSYAAVTAMNSNNNNNNNMVYGGSGSSDLIDEFQLPDQLSFMNDSALGSPTIGPKTSDLFYPQQPDSSDGMLFPPYWGNHRRSCSVTDVCPDPLGSGLGWKPCLYFARGYCKNGTSCRFLHGLPDSSDPIVGSPGKLDVMEQCQELLLRSKAQQQQQQQQQQLRLISASQLMPSSTFPYSSGKCMNFSLQQQNDTQRAAAAALMLGEDLHKFNRSRIDRNDFNPGSRQIYLTFPADSTFREEDVSNYFSIYGPVQDVRIPYQQKRMFGFVTFVYPETVKLILAKGNPHFVCDARVLVKPYKEKGKVPDKYRKQQQQVEKGEFSAACTTPTGLNSTDPYDFQLGGRMFNNTQDALLRRKLEEQGELQQAIELQSRRFMGLQLLDLRKHHHQRNLSTPIPSPTHPYSPQMNHNLIFQSSSSDRSSPESLGENCMSPVTAVTPPPGIMDQQALKVNVEKEDNNHEGNENGNENPNHDDCDFHNSLEHNLPDSPFASPTKSDGDPPSFTESAASTSSSSSSSSINNNNNNNNKNNIIASSLLPATSTLDMASFKSCFFQIPRFSSGHGAIGM